MRFSGTPIVTALQNAPIGGLAPRQFVWIRVRDLVTNVETGYGFWNGALPVTLDVIDGFDGSTVSRTYQGDGALVSVSKIVLSANIRVRQASFALNPLHPTVALAMRGYNAFRARVEIHRVPLSPVSKLPVDTPKARFVGFVDGSPIDTPAAGGETTISVNCISRTVDLTQTNPAKRSDETQRLRSGDRHMQYADVCHLWTVPWGEADTDLTDAPTRGRGQRG